MSDPPGRRRPRAKKNLLPELIIPALALGFTVYYLSTITEVPWIAQASAVTVAALLLVAIAVFLLRSVWRLRRGEVELRLRGTLGRRSLLLRRLGLLALTVGYIAAIETLGFTLTTFLFLLLAILLLSSPGNWPRALAVAAASALGGYWVFVVLFGTRFPLGVVERLLGWH